MGRLEGVPLSSSLMMNIVQNLDLPTIQRIIRADFPNFEIESIQLINNGWDNVVAEINHDLIFRFPKNNEFTFYKDPKTAFEVEVKILNQSPSNANLWAN